MRRLNGICNNTTSSSSVRIEDSVDLLSSLLQSTTLGFCTGSYESAKYTCERQMEARRPDIGMSDKSVPSVQPCVNGQCPPHVPIQHRIFPVPVLGGAVMMIRE